MRVLGLWFFALMLPTSAQVNAERAHRQKATSDRLPAKGEFYELARPKLLAEGWRPVPVKCSAENTCFVEYPEMATPAVGDTCGLLTRSDDVLRICLEGGVADALPIGSISLTKAHAVAH